MTWLLLLALEVSPVESVSLAPDSPCAPRAALARELARVGVSLAEGGDLEVRLTPTAAGLELSVSREGALVLRRALQGSCDEAGAATAVILERYLHELPAPQVKSPAPGATAASAPLVRTQALGAEPRRPSDAVGAPAPRPVAPASRDAGADRLATRRAPAPPLPTPTLSLPTPPLPTPVPTPPPSVSAPPLPTPVPTPPPSVSAPPLPTPPPSVSAPPLPTPPPSVSAPTIPAPDDGPPRREVAAPSPGAPPVQEERRAPPPVVTVDVRPAPAPPPAPVSVTDWQVLAGGGALGPTTTTLSPLLQLHGSLVLGDRWRLGLLALFSFGGSVLVTQSSIARGTLSTRDGLALPQVSACTGAAALRLCGGLLAGLRVTAGQATGDLLFQTALRLAPAFTAGAQVDATLRLGAFRAGLAAALLVNPAPATFGIEGLEASLTTALLEGFVILSVGVGPR